MGGGSSIVGMGTVALQAGYGCEPNARIIASQRARRVAPLAQVHRRAKSALLRMTQCAVLSLIQAVVLLQYFAKTVVGQGYDLVIVDALHGFGGDHRIDHGFFGGLHGGKKDRIE